MRTILISCILICFQNLQCHSQTFIDTTKVWTVGEQITDGQSYSYPKTVSYRFENDSLFNEILYKKMVKRENAGSWEFHSLWREDNNANIYCKRGLNETIVYNFTISEGEVFNEESMNPIFIDSIRTKEFGSDMRKIIYSHYEGIPDHIIQWIDGVGSLYAPFITDHYFLVGGKYTLICFTENDYNIYLNQNYSDCDATTSIKHIETPSKLLHLSIENGFIKIEKTNNSEGIFRIYNLSGQLISIELLNNQVNTISSHQSGLLFYNYQENGQYEKGKLLIY